MEENNLYFLKPWLKILVKVLATLCMLTFVIIYKKNADGNILDIILIIVAIILAVYVYIYFILNKNKKYIYKGFQTETSRELLNYYDNIFSKTNTKISDNDAVLVSCKCLICCFYGEFDKVKQMLNEINWNARNPYVQSQELLVKATVCYLESENYEEGLRLSRLNEKLGNISIPIPGKKIEQSISKTYIIIGELLNGNLDNNLIESLEAYYKKSQIPHKLLIASCLAKVYLKMNMTEKAEDKILYCKQVAPYCKILFN
ncbi:hypothetical protein [Candidatus Clostridium radicumherbarum]|uniref:Tetratricopeptide repeat protein n=1 Tax=Candidatus Clostridium radicumherbarum TaxID=3381662 RepID=A0ABW8TV99_9CLOT